jgi:hypothetical protein
MVLGGLSCPSEWKLGADADREGKVTRANSDGVWTTGIADAIGVAEQKAAQALQPPSSWNTPVSPLEWWCAHGVG